MHCIALRPTTDYAMLTAKMVTFITLEMMQGDPSTRRDAHLAICNSTFLGLPALGQRRSYFMAALRQHKLFVCHMLPSTCSGTCACTAPGSNGLESVQLACCVHWQAVTTSFDHAWP